MVSGDLYMKSRSLEFNDSASSVGISLLWKCGGTQASIPHEIRRHDFLYIT